MPLRRQNSETQCRQGLHHIQDFTEKTKPFRFERVDTIILKGLSDFIFL